jgi:hypothetical protein
MDKVMVRQRLIRRGGKVAYKVIIDLKITIYSIKPLKISHMIKPYKLQ